MAACPVELTGVTKTFGSVHALRDAQFAIADGERACLLGPNGAGKTTIIRLLTGALAPTRGAVRVYGATTHDAAFLEAKRRIGIVPQAPGMYRDLKVNEYLDLVRQLYGHGEVGDVADVFGLEPYRDRFLAQLSGGYQRRVVLAAALLPQPDLLLLDEPTVGLDPVATHEVHAYLRTMMHGRTTLLCTHNLHEAEALCDTVIILRGGRVLLHDRIEQLRVRTQPHVELAAVEGTEPLMHTLRSRGFVPEVRDGAVRIRLAEPRKQTPALLRDLLADGLQVYECHVITPSLEDVFLEIVGATDDGA